MKKFLIVMSNCMLLGLFFANFRFVKAQGLSQQPTIAIPTVTGTPKGVTATVLLNQDESINVRSGPGRFFNKVGVLLPGQEAPVRGRSAGGDWVMIDYPGAPNNVGWIYAPLVQISPGELPIVEPPSTPTPIMTQTINPTLAAQFISTPNPTRLPTYTPSNPLVIPTYEDVSRTSVLGGIPMGLVILIIGGIGGLLAIFSVIRNR
ncbi:MAG: SH3 domain-containing protein [Pelolinea sp.]|nr:SH3 domain-containing protein [Pelolinea sp.]